MSAPACEAVCEAVREYILVRMYQGDWIVCRGISTRTMTPTEAETDNGIHRATRSFYRWFPLVENEGLEVNRELIGDAICSHGMWRDECPCSRTACSDCTGGVAPGDLPCPSCGGYGFFLMTIWDGRVTEAKI